MNGVIFGAADPDADDEFLGNLTRLSPAYTRFSLKKGIENFQFYRAVSVQLHWINGYDEDASDEFEALIKMHRVWRTLGRIWDVFHSGVGGWSRDAFEAIAGLVVCCLSGACSADSKVPRFGSTGPWASQQQQSFVPLSLWLADMQPILGSIVPFMKKAMSNAEKRRSPIVFH